MSIENPARGRWKRGLWICAAILAGLPARAADWPTFRGDSHRSGVSSESLEWPLGEAWTYRPTHTPRPAWPGPAENNYWHRLHGLSPTMIYDRAFHVVVAQGALLFGSSSDDAVYCLSSDSGRERWSFITEGPVRLAPTVTDGKVYFGSDDGCVYCLDLDRGDLLWKRRAGPEDHRLPGNGRLISLWPVRSGVVVENGVAYYAAGLFPDQGAFLCAADAEDGAEIWRKKLSVTAQGYLLASPTRLLVPAGRTAPQVYDRADGRSLGQLGSTGGSFAIVLDDMVIQGVNEAGQIEISAPDTQERIVTTQAMRVLANGPMAWLLQSGTLTALDRTGYLELSRKILAIEGIAEENRTAEQRSELIELREAREACRRWEAPCDSPFEMILAGGAVIAGGQDRVVAYDAADGSVRWTGAVDGRAYGLAASDGRLYVSTDSGAIHCFESPSEAGSWPDPSPPSNLPDDLLHIGRLSLWDAKRILEKGGVDRGYCLVLGRKALRLANAVTRLSQLSVVAVDEAKGPRTPRVSVHRLSPGRLPYQGRIMNLVTGRYWSPAGGGIPPVAAEEVRRLLRPCGGTAVFISDDQTTLEEWGAGVLPGWKVEVNDDGEAWGMARMGPLEGGGEWTHTYAEPGNSANSGDTLVHGDMDLQWFGRPGPREMIDRHHRNVPPLYKDGRCFVPGDQVVFAVDAYNGTPLWTARLADSRRLGVFLDSTNLVLDAYNLYWAAGDRCHAFDVETGEESWVYQMLQDVEGYPRDWGYLARVEGLLLGSACKTDASYTETSRDADSALWYRGMNVVFSDYLFALECSNELLRWWHKSGRIANPTIASGGGRTYFIETHSEASLNDPLGRMPLSKAFEEGQQRLVALETASGDVLYEHEVDTSKLEEVCYLSYADETLLLSGSRFAQGTVEYHYFAFDAATGEHRWSANHLSGLPDDGGHGEYNRHPTIIGRTVYAWPYAYDLETGERIEGWSFQRQGHGCGGISASACSLFWRGGNPWMYDLTPGGGPRRINAVSRPGCWINIIPAGGLVLIPEASSGCTCAFPIQTSMTYRPGRPLPRVEPDSSLYAGAFEVELSDPLGGGTIRYTLDGSPPDEDSSAYEGPIHMDGNPERVRLMARTFWPDGERSRLLEHSWTRVEMRPADRVAGRAPGLRYEAREGEQISRLSDLERWEVVARGTHPRFDLDVRSREESFAISFSGFVEAPRDGLYTFFTASDDGSSLEIGDRIVVDNDGLHGTREASGQIALQAGLHPIAVRYFEAGGAQSLRVSWEGPGISKAEIPPTALWRAP